jgi:hypothetical protein
MIKNLVDQTMSLPAQVENLIQGTAEKKQSLYYAILVKTHP